MSNQTELSVSYSCSGRWIFHRAWLAFRCCCRRLFLGWLAATSFGLFGGCSLLASSSCTSSNSIFGWGRWGRGFHVWWGIMLEFHQYLAHPRAIGGLARLWPLHNNDGRLLLLLFLSPPLLNVGYLVWYQLWNCFPVMLFCIGVELLLVGQE